MIKGFFDIGACLQTFRQYMVIEILCIGVPSIDLINDFVTSTPQEHIVASIMENLSHG
jgi:hypothetical protein